MVIRVYLRLNVSQELERELNRELYLPRVAHTLTKEAIKIEKSRRRERVDIIGVVEGIEHLDARNQRIPLAEFEWTLEAPVK